MRICYQAIDGFRTKALHVWREDKPEVLTVTTHAEIWSHLAIQRFVDGEQVGDVVIRHTPREAGEWVENWLRTYDS